MQHGITYQALFRRGWCPKQTQTENWFNYFFDDWISFQLLLKNVTRYLVPGFQFALANGRDLLLVQPGGNAN
jgi:hypothetical protein